MERMKLPAGYRFPPGRTMADVRNLDEELLGSEARRPQAPEAKAAKGKDARKRD